MSDTIPTAAAPLNDAALAISALDMPDANVSPSTTQHAGTPSHVPHTVQLTNSPSGVSMASVSSPEALMCGLLNFGSCSPLTGSSDRALDRDDTMYHGRTSKSRVSAAQKKRQGSPLRTRRSTRSTKTTATLDVSKSALPPITVPPRKRRTSSSPSHPQSKRYKTTSDAGTLDNVQATNHDLDPGAESSDLSDVPLDEYDLKDPFIDDGERAVTAEGLQSSLVDEGNESHGSFYVDDNSTKDASAGNDNPPPLESCPDPSKPFVAYDHNNASTLPADPEKEMFEAFLRKFRSEPGAFFAFADMVFKNLPDPPKESTSSLASPFTGGPSFSSGLEKPPSAELQPSPLQGGHGTAPALPWSAAPPQTPTRTTSLGTSLFQSHSITPTVTPSPGQHLMTPSITPSSPASATSLPLQRRTAVVPGFMFKSSNPPGPIPAKKPSPNLVSKGKGNEKEVRSIGASGTQTHSQLSMKDLVKKGNPKAISGASGSSGPVSFRNCMALPSVCGVNNIDLQDELLAHTYSQLPHLRPGTLIPWTGMPGPGQCAFSAWGEQCPEMAGLFPTSLAMAAILFSMFQELLNPSRGSPLSVELRQIRIKQYTRLNVYRGAKPMIGVSCGFVTESQLLTPSDSGLRQKYIRIIMHSQEWERFTSWMCMVFGQQSLHAQLARDAMEFSTRPHYNNAAAEEKPSTSSGMFKTKKGLSPAGSGKPRSSTDVMSLGPDDPVPIYDGRNSQFNFDTDLPNLDSILPRFEREVPYGSFAVVGYTVSAHNPAPKKWNLKCYVRWVIVLGTPPETEDEIESETGNGMNEDFEMT
ncbi:hypothetical protein BJ165DRAFT_1401887 [Panaeolus papilionaceus]|nr:hypothetical protein BJ165DRAFT_1401887 [Panaeolus papilionaceus]